MLFHIVIDAVEQVGYKSLLLNKGTEEWAHFSQTSYGVCIAILRAIPAYLTKAGEGPVQSILTNNELNHGKVEENGTLEITNERNPIATHAQYDQESKADSPSIAIAEERTVECLVAPSAC